MAAFAFATLFLMLTAASAIAQSFGSAEEARAMLDRAVAALKSDEAKALREFSDADNKEFHDRDLYVSCFNTADGKFTAAPSAMLGTDIRTFDVGDDPIGQRAFDAVQATPEGTVVAMDYIAKRPELMRESRHLKPVNTTKRTENGNGTRSKTRLRG